MVLKNSIHFINGLFFYLTNQFRKIYLNSSFYNKKISKIDDKTLDYKPSLNLLNCIVKYEKKKEKIENFYLNSIWKNNNLKNKDYSKLHSFFWMFSLDLKSSKKVTQSIILNWIEANKNYNQHNWEIDILSKRIISWISNSRLTYEDSSSDHKINFDYIIKKQINHLMNEIDNSDRVDDKMIGCTAVILTGLSYNDEKYLNFGLTLLKKIIKFSFSPEVFPKSRNMRQLVFYIKYFILIREFLKESQNEIPNYLNEVIFYLGQAYNFIFQSSDNFFLFNGNHNVNYADFNKYLVDNGYKFKSDFKEIGGYAIFRNKNISIAMDIGPPPEKKFSNNYQSGTLSMEISYLGKKLITNCGYFQDFKHQLNNISKSTAAHSTLVIDNNSICSFKKDKSGNSIVQKNFKIINKKLLMEKKFWSLKGSHDGYQSRYGIIHEREIQFFPENKKIFGIDKLIKKKNFKSSNFDIRFHLNPDSKVTKIQDGKSILIEIENSGWRFNCKEHFIGIETGLYFGKKNSFTENQNIYISGNTENKDQIITWELIQI